VDQNMTKAISLKKSGFFWIIQLNSKVRLSVELRKGWEQKK